VADIPRTINVGQYAHTVRIADLANRFSYHPPLPGQPERYEKIRAFAHDTARLISEECPESREKSLALTHLEEAVMWANAAIARHDERPASG
jgi:hypothetical protein